VSGFRKSFTTRRKDGRKDILVSEGKTSSLSTCAPDSHLLRVTIPDAASIKFNLLMMSSKHVEDYIEK